MWQRMGRLTPYLWPSKSRGLQFVAVRRIPLRNELVYSLLAYQCLCILIVVIGRGVNLAVPWSLSQIIRIFEEGGPKSAAWPYLFAYVGLRFLQAAGGLPALRDVSVVILWFLTYSRFAKGSLGPCHAILGSGYVLSFS